MIKQLHALIERTMFWLAGVALFVMMMLVSADVLARYVLNAPLTFQFEFTTNYLMVMVATLGLPWCERKGSFIHLSVIRRFLSPRAGRYLDALGYIVAAVTLYAIAWFSGHRTWEKYIDGNAYFGVIDWPVWLSLIWVPIGCFMLGLRLNINAVMYCLWPQAIEADNTSDSNGTAQ